MYKLGKSSLNNISNINELLQILVKKAIIISKIDFGIISNGGLRTSEEQNELFKRGVSKCDGYKKISYHQTGNAVDLIPYTGYRYTWDIIEYFYAINEAIMKSWEEMKEEGLTNGYSLIWGGNWTNFKDYPHYELREI